jgi:hypothetical protein
MANTPALNLVKSFFQTIVEALYANSNDFGTMVITRPMPFTQHPFILSKEEATAALENHIAFIDTVGEEAIDQYNAAVSNQEDPFRAYIARGELQKDAWVYLIGTREGEYKIGWSHTPEQRIRYVEAPSRGEKELLHAIRCKDAPKTEKLLHQVFASKHIKNEWFTLTPEDVQWIKSIKEWL